MLPIQWTLSWKTTCINTRSTKVFRFNNILFSWHVFCLDFKKRNKFSVWHRAAIHRGYQKVKGAFKCTAQISAVWLIARQKMMIGIRPSLGIWDTHLDHLAHFSTSPLLILSALLSPYPQSFPSASPISPHRGIVPLADLQLLNQSYFLPLTSSCGLWFETPHFSFRKFLINKAIFFFPLLHS